MSRIIDLHRALLVDYPTVVGITLNKDGSVLICWSETPPKETLEAAQAIADKWDWAEKPMPTEADVEIKLSQMTSTAKQDLIERMLKEYLLDRPALLEKLSAESATTAPLAPTKS